jgi:hypothetical protein
MAIALQVKANNEQPLFFLAICSQKTVWKLKVLKSSALLDFQ